MRKLATVAAIALVGMLIPQGARAEGSQADGAAMEAEFVQRINALRAEQGLDALEVHSNLVAKARDWSSTMADAGEIWHSDLADGITANWKRLGENVGMGGSVEALHDAFVASPSHYENLVDPGFRHVGIGVTVDSEGTIFVAEEFMELASQPAPAAPKSAAGTPSSSSQGAPQAAPAPAVSEQPRSAPDAGAAAPAPASAPAPKAAAPADSGPRPEAGARITSVLDRLRSLES